MKGSTVADAPTEIATTRLSADLLAPRRRRRPRIGLVAGGLGTYWPQFPGLLPQLQASADYVSGRFRDMDADVTDTGFISDALDGANAAEALVPGPLLQIGNTTSRVDFRRDPGEWVDEWFATGIGHHWSLSLGRRAADYRAAAALLDIDFRLV